MNDWSKKYDCLIRISKKNRDRIKLARGNLNLASKLDEILNNYFENGGGKKEKKVLEDKIKKLYGNETL